jgi:hypothetical protein
MGNKTVGSLQYYYRNRESILQKIKQKKLEDPLYRQKHMESCRKYYAKHRDILLAKLRKKRLTDPTVKQKAHEKYIAEREERLAYSRQYYLKNKQRIKNYNLNRYNKIMELAGLRK